MYPKPPLNIHYSDKDLKPLLYVSDNGPRFQPYPTPSRGSGVQVDGGWMDTKPLRYIYDISGRMLSSYGTYPRIKYVS